MNEKEFVSLVILCTEKQIVIDNNMNNNSLLIDKILRAIFYNKQKNIKIFQHNFVIIYV